MKKEDILQVIRGPHVTEKSSMVAQQKQLVFKVARSATKAQIKEAVEQLLGIKVININTINVSGKIKRFGMRTGSRKDYKKVYVGLDKNVDMETLLLGQA